ncbi:MAG: hypothetical protein N3E39_00325 [Candidatus Methanomethylicia archaeon]|nr:hypothetical protein [Candidatus Methanomethylicia archaeon]
MIKRMMISMYLASFIVTLYSLEAYKVAQYVYDGEYGICWRTSPPGSFLPWPKPSGILQVLSDMNYIDKFVYNNLIKNNVMIMTVYLIWIITLMFTIKFYINRKV